MNIKYLLLIFLGFGPHAKDIMVKGEKENQYLLIKLLDKKNITNDTNDGVDYRSVPLSKSCNNKNDWDHCMRCFFQSWETMCVKGKGYCRSGYCKGWLSKQGV